MRSSRVVRTFFLTSRARLPVSPHFRCLSATGLEGPEPSGRSHGRSAALGTAAGVIASGLGLVWYFHTRNKDAPSQSSLHKIRNPLQLNAYEGRGKKESGEAEKKKVSIRERRYKDFSSLRYKGEPYMTPRDFLESVTLDEPRQHESLFIGDKEVSQLLKAALPRSKGSKVLFREMWNNGIITYGDYLFLLTALVKTTRQFKIAFKMIDADGNDFVDEKEFCKVHEAVTKQRENALIQQRLKQSTLTIHLFGQRGNQNLYSKDFYQFIENLQTEVLEIEFNKYAGGAPTISEEDFAQILLRHTTWDMDPVFARLKRKTKPETGISFEQFRCFCQLLNNLDDFEIAMTMFTIAGTSITEEEFGRAAKICIGKSLDKFVVDTVFDIFDVDGDGKLSYKEFVAVMKSWKLRGFKMREHKHIGGWSEFKTCVKMEMKA